MTDWLDPLGDKPEAKQAAVAILLVIITLLIGLIFIGLVFGSTN